MQVFAIHGFTGNIDDFDCPVIPLPGHQGIDEDCSLEMALQRVHEALPNEPAHLLGYSMGARVALLYALENPTRVGHLTLISANPGIEDNHERLIRKEADLALADKIESLGIDAFIDFWQNQPLIADQREAFTNDQYNEFLKKRKQHNAQGLANCLRALGQGVCPNLWPRLSELSIPVTLITGQNDPKYTTIARRMLESIPNAKHQCIPGVGHAPHLKS